MGVVNPTMPGHAPDEGPRSTSLNRPVAYQLKITLADIQPPIWRRVLVPGLLTLDQLHHVIQPIRIVTGHELKFEAGGIAVAFP